MLVLGVMSGPGLAQQATPPAPAPLIPVARSELPIEGIAQVTIQVSDLRKASHYYSKVLGFAPAFRSRYSSSPSQYFKVNDDQYI